MDWKTREQTRLDTHVYKPLSPDLARFCLPEHYAHRGRFPACCRGLAVASTIAFTRNDDEGARDIQRRMRVATYLMTYVLGMTEDEALRIEALELVNH